MISMDMMAFFDIYLQNFTYYDENILFMQYGLFLEKLYV